MLGIYSLESLLIVPHILRREWLICLVFRLVDDAWLLHDYRVPLTFRDLKSETAFTRVQIVASNTSCHGKPYLLRASINGSGSNSSTFHTPGRFHKPFKNIMAPIMAGTPVV